MFNENGAARQEKTPQQRFDSSSERAKAEAVATFWMEKLSAAVKQTEAKLEAAKLTGDAKSIQNAERMHRGAYANFQKLFNVAQVFHDFSAETDIEKALRDQYTRAEAKLAADKRVIPGMPDSAWEEQDAKITSLLDALDFIEREKGAPTAGNKPFKDWLPAGYASGLLRAEVQAETKSARAQEVPRPAPTAAGVVAEARTKARHAQATREDADYVAEIQAKLERERFMEELLRAGGVFMHTSMKTGRSAGFQEFWDPRLDKTKSPVQRTIEQSLQYVPESWKPGQPMSKRYDSTTLEDLKKIKETVVLRPLEVTRSRTVEQKASGIKGMFGGTEQRQESYVEQAKNVQEFVPHAAAGEAAYVLEYRAADNEHNVAGAHAYVDYTGRPGQMFDVKLIISESLARKALAEVQKNPNFIRELVEKAALTNSAGAITKGIWEKGENHNGAALRPPYEAWKRLAGGVNRMLIQDRTRTTDPTEAMRFRTQDVITF